jgi:hypothetical protein
MLEGTDARVHYVYQTPEMETARNRGGLQTNAFVRLRKLFSGGRPRCKSTSWVMQSRSYATRSAFARPRKNRSGEESCRKITVGMDGLVAIKRRLRRPARRSNANASRRKPRSRRNKTLAASQRVDRPSPVAQERRLARVYCESARHLGGEIGRRYRKLELQRLADEMARKVLSSENIRCRRSMKNVTWVSRD